MNTQATIATSVDRRTVPSTFIRQADHGELYTPIPGLLEGRVTVLVSSGGVGKTTLCEQIIRHVGSNHRLGRFDMPETPMRVWALFLEDIEALTQDRSHRAARLGTLAEDQLRGEIGEDNVHYSYGRDWSMGTVREELEQLQKEDLVPGLVIVDHLRLLIGYAPSGSSPNAWERTNMDRLTEMAEEFRTHFLVLTHLNKLGAVSGTTDIMNATDNLFVIEPGESRDKASLTCLKLRMSPMTDYALSKFNNGTWGFDDEGTHVSEAQARGISVDILRTLRAEGPQSLSELCMHPAIGGTRAGIRAALDRCKRRGWIRLFRSMWEIVPGDGDLALRAPESDSPCDVCGGPMVLKDARTHPTCDMRPTVPAPRAPEPPPAPPAAAPADEEHSAPVWNGIRGPETDIEQDDEEPSDPEVWNGVRALKASIARSRMHPRPALTLPERGAGAYEHITERMGGEPRWKAPELVRSQIREGGDLVLLDRNGSYPSACSSVILAPNKLLHTGPLDSYDKSRAGIFQVPRVDWDTAVFPHPLGKIADQEGDSHWVTTQHLRLLLALADGGHIEHPVILDSWTGRANASLFEPFYKECRSQRQQLVAAGGGEPYIDYKRSLSKALRLLWPKGSNSPFFRPDWRVAMVAEASVRHWLKARQAVRTEEAVLLELGSVDEVLFWTPDGRPPANKELGDNFGQVKVKEIKA